MDEIEDSRKLEVSYFQDPNLWLYSVKNNSECSFFSNASMICSRWMKEKKTILLEWRCPYFHLRSPDNCLLLNVYVMFKLFFINSSVIGQSLTIIKCEGISSPKNQNGICETRGCGCWTFFSTANWTCHSESMHSTSLQFVALQQHEQQYLYIYILIFL